jgi:uncharacterized protein with ATP-grasp and redox domains
MKITADCVPCLLKRGVYETRLVKGDEAGAMKAALDVLGQGYGPGVCSAVLATRMHKAVYDHLGTDDPYKELKREANDAARALLGEARDFVNASPDRLKAAATCAVVGNVMDFGIEGSSDDPGAMRTIFAGLAQAGLDHDDLVLVRDRLTQGARVVYFLDNCGEVIFDTLLVRELKDLGVHVTIVAKGEPILTDATMEDAVGAGLDELADGILTTGTYAVGMDMHNIPGDVADAMEEADLIISKGMANYEAMTEKDFGPVLHLMRTKCSAVSASLGLPMNLSIAALVEGVRE